MDGIENFKKVWVCNECNTQNFTQSVSKSDIEQGLLSCIDCGCNEFHIEKVILLKNENSI